MVVKTAIVEQPISSHSITLLDAIARTQLGRDARAHHEITAPIAMHHDEHRERHAADAAQLDYSAAAALHRLTDRSAAGTLPATRLRTSLITSDSSLPGSSRTPAGRCAVTRCRMMASWNASHSPMTTNAGKAHHMAVITP